MQITHTIPELPLEMIDQVLSYLKPNPSDLRIAHIYNTSQVCKSWYSLSEPIIKDFRIQHQQPFVADLPSEMVNEVFSYLPPNRLYSRAINIYSASQVCKSWNRILAPLIKEMGNRALENIKLTKIEGNRGPLSAREFNIIGSLADENFVSPRLVTRVITQEAPTAFTLKILGLAKAVTLRDFNEAVTSRADPEVLLALFDKLTDKRQDCIVSAVERGDLNALETLISSPHYNFSDELILEHAISFKKDNILAFILEKNPALEKNSIYNEFLLIKFLSHQDYKLVATLLEKNPYLKISEFQVLSHPEAYEFLLNRYLELGNKLSLESFRKKCMLINNFLKNQEEKEKSLKLVCEMYIRSNHVTNFNDDIENLRVLFTRILSLPKIMQEIIEKYKAIN